jgi:hypothetical protein
MGPGTTYFVTTFLAGTLCGLGWLYATADNPRSLSMLKQSLWLILLPMLLAPGPLLTFPLGMWVGVGFEEGIKAFASTKEQQAKNKFWLVSLFGVWELALDKPILGLVIAQSTESWDRTSLFWLLLAGTVPVLLHAVTAAIYAFCFESRLWAAFITSWLIHTAYNESVNYFEFSPAVSLARAAILALLLAAVMAKRGGVTTVQVT